MLAPGVKISRDEEKGPVRTAPHHPGYTVTRSLATRPRKAVTSYGQVSPSPSKQDAEPEL